jgi:hypothetical protein
MSHGLCSTMLSAHQQAAFDPPAGAFLLSQLQDQQQLHDQQQQSTPATA